MHRTGRSTVKEAGNGAAAGAGMSTDVRSGGSAIEIIIKEVGVDGIEIFAIDGGLKLCLGECNGGLGFHEFGAQFTKLEGGSLLINRKQYLYIIKMWKKL